MLIPQGVFNLFILYSFMYFRGGPRGTPKTNFWIWRIRSWDIFGAATRATTGVIFSVVCLLCRLCTYYDAGAKFFLMLFHTYVVYYTSFKLEHKPLLIFPFTQVVYNDLNVPLGGSIPFYQAANPPTLIWDDKDAYYTIIMTGKIIWWNFLSKRMYQ